eukprot:3455646-Amphidinium_carterae.1
MKPTQDDPQPSEILHISIGTFGLTVQAKIMTMFTRARGCELLPIDPFSSPLSSNVSKTLSQERERECQALSQSRPPETPQELKQPIKDL